MEEIHDQNGWQCTSPGAPGDQMSDSGTQTARSKDRGLMVNADDWGLNRETTDRTLDCIHCGAVSSVSAMVFMEDSDRAADIACNHGVDTGLHLNVTSPFTATRVSSVLIAHQSRLSHYLLGSRYSQIVFNPVLIRSFEYVVAAQLDEFSRLYGDGAARIDGHHHMHLCANILLGGLLPPGTAVRRSFSFQPGEKSFANRYYRQAIDNILGRRHRLTDYFFSIQPLSASSRLQRILELSRKCVVEMETHPGDPAEHSFLVGKEFQSLISNNGGADRFKVGAGT